MNRFIAWCYQNFLKPIFFIFDPEKVHDFFVSVGEFLGRHELTRKITRGLFSFSHPSLHQKILGIDFVNPVGLPAGFDKGARLTKILPDVGFGFMEVGSITGEPCAGNPKPRLWRLLDSEGLLVYYGLKNEGAVVAARRLRHRPLAAPVFVSVAKTNCADTITVEAGVADYAKAFEELSDVGQATVVNISCPSVFGGEPFTVPDSLEILLTRLDEIPTHKPTFLKISPDLTPAEIDMILAVAERHRVHGFICGNLTKKRDNPLLKEENIPATGGISGRPAAVLSDELIKYIFQRTGGQYVIIGCGGIFSAADAYRKIRLGASLVQVLTGMIFVGPQLIGDINRGLVELLRHDGFRNISEAVGMDALAKTPKNQ